MKKIVSAKKAPPVGISPLSHAVESDGLVFTSGQVHFNNDMELVGDTTEEKTKQVMQNLAAILEASDLTFKDVIKATVYFTDMSIYKEFNDTYATYFDGEFPAREVVCVKELPLGADLEISMVAAK